MVQLNLHVVYFHVMIYGHHAALMNAASPISRQFVHILRGGEFVRIRTTSLVQIHTIFAKSYVFYELGICMNLYE